MKNVSGVKIILLFTIIIIELLQTVIVGPVAAFQKIWIFGDEFGFHTFAKYYQQKANGKFGYANYDVPGYVNNSCNSIDTNMVSHYRNLLIGAIADQPQFGYR